MKPSSQLLVVSFYKFHQDLLSVQIVVICIHIHIFMWKNKTIKCKKKKKQYTLCTNAKKYCLLFLLPSPSLL